MRVVAWGFSMPTLCESFARELARLPGRNDLVLQIDPDTRTIDFSSVRVTEFLRTDCRQIESLARAVEKDPSVSVVFDMWRFLLSDGFEDALEPIMKVARSAKRCLLVAPARASHFTALLPQSRLPARGAAVGESDAFLAKLCARVLALHERFLSVEGDVTLVCAPPPVEAFWALIGINVLQPARTLGLSFAPRVLKESGASFSSVGSLARELAALVPRQDVTGGRRAAPWVDAGATVEVAWPEGLRAFDCTWERYLTGVGRKERTLAAVLPHYATEQNRALLARALHAYGMFAKGRVPNGALPSADMALLFPPIPPRN